MSLKPDNRQIAAALRSADWSNTSIGNKAMILAAIEALEPDKREEWLKLVRVAFNHGYWAWAGPANEHELQEVIKGEEEAWTAWSAEHLPRHDEAGK